MSDAPPTAGPVRAIELVGAGEGIAAAYAGWLLARMGASVERLHAGGGPPPGSSADAGPIGLARQALAAGKADASVPAGDREAFDARLAQADLLLCDDPAGLAALAGTPRELVARRPRLVVGVASTFGLDGPYAELPGTGLDAQALSGVAWALGEPGREPLTLPPGIVEHQAGAMLAAGCLLALAVRDERGTGRVVDVALAEVLASYVAGNCRFYVHHGLRWHRSGRRASGSGGAYPFAILPCRDGEVCITGRTRDEWNRLVGAMGSPAWAAQPRYQDLRAMGRVYPDEVDALVMPWLASRTKAELERIALDAGLILSPIRGFADVLGTRHFHDDGFLEPATLGGRTLLVPTLPFRAGARRAADAPDLAPTLLGAIDAPAGSARRAARPVDPARPLAGVRVLDLGWVWSAPWVGTMLGELGAEVVKVEHGSRPDNLRLAGKVIRDGRVVEGPSTEMSPMYHQINHGKLGITLNLKSPRAAALVERLAAISDVVVENMTPGSLERQRLGWDTLSRANPRLVMLSMSSMGQFGELSTMRAYAPTMSSFAGMEALVGYPGEAPIGALNCALADPNASVHALVALLAALRRARATGEGCYLDVAQVEALLGTLRPYLLAAQADARQPAPRGNAHPSMAPHGIYPALGDDAWLTIAVADDAQWRALCAVARASPGAPEGGHGWASDEGLAHAAARLARASALDAQVAAWTAGQPRDALVAALRAAGVASSPVLPIDEAWRDPQLVARRIMHPVELPFYGPEPLFRAPWRFSDFEPRIDRCGPRLGEHNDHVFGALLGLGAEEIAALKAEGVIA